jgi:tripartite-type tricarboxylate transporter receptor subunit TctC
MTRSSTPKPVTMSRAAGAVALSVACLGLFAIADAAHAKVTFTGKTVRLIVGSPPGGGTDVGARLFGRFFGEYLPGKPTIVVQNVPGAGGIKAMNYMVEQIAPDGTTVLAGSSGEIAPDVLLRNKATHYDATKFAYIGGVASTGTVTIANKAAMARMLKDHTPIAVAQVGGARTGAQMALFGAEYLNWKIKWISGYPGTAAMVLALLKGEADLTDTAGLAAMQPLLQDKHFAPVVQAGIFVDGKLKRRDEFPDTPMIGELIRPKLKTDLEKEAYESWERTIQIGKFFALPPGTPKDYVAAYINAFESLAKDSAFKKAAKAQLDDDYVLISAAHTQEVIDGLAKTPDRDLDFLLRLRAKFGLPADKVKKKPASDHPKS